MAGDRHSYRAFGQIISSDCRLPLLLQEESAARPSLTIHKAPYPELSTTSLRPWVRSQDLTPSGDPWLAAWRLAHDGGFHLRFGGGEEITIDGGGRHIWSSHIGDDATAPVTGYLYGISFGLAFYLQGATCLHASAVAVGQKALLFAGDAGCGKSSTAVTLVRQGYPLITDDLVVLDPTTASMQIPPAFPAMRLRSDVAIAQFGPDHGLPPLHGDADKVLLQLDKPSDFFTERAPLAAVYLLRRSGPPTSGLPIRPLGQRDALLALAQLGYLPNLMDKKMRRAEFAMLSAVVTSRPVFQLPALSDPARLPQLCQEIAAHGSRL